MEEFQRTINLRKKDSQIRISSFSDSIFITCPTITEKALNEVFYVISELCFKTVSYGFFARGALTLGYCQEKAGITFGPACVRAYELENEGIWPRCVIDPILLTRSDIYPDNTWRKYNHYVLMGSDGLPYLDYLGYIFVSHLIESYLKSQENVEEAIKDLNAAPKLVLMALKGHKEAIYKAVEKARQNKEQAIHLFTKYYPLALYHNEVISRLIPDEDNTDFFRRISDNLEYIMGEKIIEKQLRDDLSANVKEKENWRTELQQLSIDTDSLFDCFHYTGII